MNRSCKIPSWRHLLGFPSLCPRFRPASKAADEAGAQHGASTHFTQSSSSDRPHAEMRIRLRPHLSLHLWDSEAQQGRNVTLCHCSHSATIEHGGQLAAQCLHADRCRSSSAPGCCGVPLSSFNSPGNQVAFETHQLMCFKQLD